MASHDQPGAHGPNGTAAARERRAARSQSRRYRCIKLAGDKNAGLLLDFIVGWAPKAKVRHPRASGYWNVNSIADILERTGLTREQYFRARKILIEADMARFRRGLFMGSTNHVFTQPNPQVGALLDDALTYWEAREILARPDSAPDSAPDSGPDSHHHLYPSIPSTPSNSRTSSRAEARKGREGPPAGPPVGEPAHEAPKAPANGVRPAGQPRPVSPGPEAPKAPPEDAQICAAAESPVDEAPPAPESPEPIVVDWEREDRERRVAAVREVMSRGLDEDELRRELLRICPDRSGSLPGMWHHSERSDWTRWSPEVIVRRQEEHERFVDNKRAKNGQSRIGVGYRSREESVAWDAHEVGLTPQEYIRLQDEDPDELMRIAGEAERRRIEERQRQARAQERRR